MHRWQSHAWNWIFVSAESQRLWVYGFQSLFAHAIAVSGGHLVVLLQ